MARSIKNEPTADVLMVSMRAMGYSFEVAIADIIDNSISAKATIIELKFPIDPQNCYVAICDNGCGMDRDELFDAMKYGSKIKNKYREADDLGRFGLGLKSASLSQCRKLTVLSKKNNKLTAYAWDLDNVEQKKGWEMIEYNREEITKIKFLSFLDNYDSGTVVLWENFDLIEKSLGSIYTELSKFQDSVADYLSLIFHRFLNKDKPNNVEIKMNNYSLVGLDPFLTDHKKTNPRREIKLPVEDADGIERYVVVQPFVLPFQKDLSREDFKKIGGVEDYRTKQGFYIYRNERLIIWGTWFGRTKGELTKHARVRVDIPNYLDDIWGIDIKKQSAKIPNIIKKQLTKAVDEAMDIAIKTQTYRGRIEKIDENIDYIWDRVKDRGDKFAYKVNRNSKMFDLIKDSADDELWNKIEMVIEEIENNIPYQQIYIDKAQNNVLDEITDDRLEDVKSKAEMFVSIALRLGNSSRVTIIDELFKSEPFSKYPKLKEILLSEV